MVSMFNPLRSPLLSPLANPLARRGGGGSIPLDDQIIAMLTGPADAYYRVSDLDTLFSDRGGAAATTPAVVDGPVGTIKDKGPNGYHKTAAADVNRGILRFVDGVYYIEGDGSTTRYTTGAIVTTSWVHYLASSSRRRNATSGSFGLRSSSSVYHMLISAGTSVAQNASRNAGGLGVVSAAAGSAPINTFLAADSISKPGSAGVAVGGGAYATSAISLTDVAANFILGVLGSTGGSIEASQLDWCGGLYLNHEPTADQRATINLLMAGLYDPSVLTDLGLIIE